MSNSVAKYFLIVIAPVNLWDVLKKYLTRLYPETLYIPRPLPNTTIPLDPFGVAKLMATVLPQSKGVLLIAPRRRAPGRLLPATVIHSVPVGIVQADKPEQLIPWLEALKVSKNNYAEPLWASMAMNQDFYLEWGQRWTHWLTEAGSTKKIQVRSWLADTVSRDDLCQSLATGPALAIYAGHGRARGWSGYRALRWHHINSVKQEKPCGTIIGLACDTLKRTRGMVPFGCLWIGTGRACAYLGSVARLGVKANDAFARVLGQLLVTGQYKTIGELLTAADLSIEENQDKEARKGFLTYRLMGNPLQELY